MLILSVVRVVWGISQARQRPANTFAARLGHFALYALMVAVPALGMMRQAEIPLGNAHGALAMLFLLMVAGHAAMVGVHHLRGNRILSRIL